MARLSPGSESLFRYRTLVGGKRREERGRVLVFLVAHILIMTKVSFGRNITLSHIIRTRECLALVVPRKEENYGQVRIRFLMRMRIRDYDIR